MMKIFRFQPQSVQGLNRHRGSTLIVSLLFLMVITLIATGVWRMAMEQEKMAGNERDYQIAFEAAEAALRDAELDYFNVCARDAGTCTPRALPIVGMQGFGSQAISGVPAPGSCSDKGLCVGVFNSYSTGTALTKLFAGQPDPTVLDGTAPASKGVRVTYGAFTRSSSDANRTLPNVSAQPAYVVEAICYGGGSNASGCNPVFRVTAIGYGRRADTRVVLQSFLEPTPSSL